MENECVNHGKDIHQCIENIINTFLHDVVQVPHQDQKHIVVRCAQVDAILAEAKKISYHPQDHPVEWEAVIYKHRPTLACGKCGNFFTNKVLEEARKLKII